MEWSNWCHTEREFYTNIFLLTFHPMVVGECRDTLNWLEKHTSTWYRGSTVRFCLVLPLIVPKLFFFFFLRDFIFEKTFFFKTSILKTRTIKFLKEEEKLAKSSSILAFQLEI